MLTVSLLSYTTVVPLTDLPFASAASPLAVAVVVEQFKNAKIVPVIYFHISPYSLMA